MGFKSAVLAAMGAALLVVATPAAADYTITQETEAGSASASRVGQSFTTLDAGFLTQVDLYLSVNHHASSGTLRIYEGATSPGDSAQALYVQPVSGMPTETTQWISIVIDSPPSLSAATQYTVMLDGADSTQVGLRFTLSDVYAGGTMRTDEFAQSGDIAFRLHLSAVPVELMSFSVE